MSRSNAGILALKDSDAARENANPIMPANARQHRAPDRSLEGYLDVQTRISCKMLGDPDSRNVAHASPHRPSLKREPVNTVHRMPGHFEGPQKQLLRLIYVDDASPLNVGSM